MGQQQPPPRFVNLLLWRTAQALVRLIQILPFDQRRRFCGVCGFLAYALVPRIRRVVRANLERAYGGDLPAPDARRIAHGSARHMGHAMAEFIHLPHMDTAFFQERVVVEGFEGVDPGQPVVYVAAHLGAWEWLGAAVTHAGTPITLVVRPFADPAMNAFVERFRHSQGVETIEKYGAGSSVARTLRKGRSVGIMVDQSPRQSAVPVTFFGKPCWSTAGPVLAARRTKAPLVPIMLIRLPRGRYLLRRYPPVPLKADVPLREDLVETGQRMQDVIESMVRAYPDQWLWAHRRWKRRPNLESEWETQ